jgi:two-component system sensor histidine kinase KdpD
VDALRVLGHELRRPLTVIRGASSLLIDDAEALPPPTRRQMLELIDRGAAEMSDMIDDLLTAVHLDIGDLQYLMEPVALRGLVDEAVEATRHQEPAGDVEVGGLEGLEVQADREHVVRALRAVLGNARRYSPEGEAVMVAGEVVDDVVRLQVLDRGPGIPAAQRERAFQKFTRLDPNTGGPGLGLYLARGLTRGMGGEVSLSDREDGGTVVCFTLKRRG